MRIPIASIFGLLLLATPVEGGVLDPVLRHLLRTENAPALARRAAVVSLAQDLALELDEGANDIEVRALLHLDGSVPRSLLESVPGVRVGSTDGSIATVRIPLSTVARLAELDGVEYVQVARVLEPQLERMAQNTDLVAVREATPTWTGRGTLIGIVDTGIDVEHPDLRTSEGRTRVAAIWDMDASVESPPVGYSEGRYVSRAEIDAALEGTSTLPHVDENGHGTHLAGVAAGNGALSLQTRRGAAPEAELAVVAADRLTEDRVIDGLRFLVEEAGRQEKPLVVCLAASTSFGPHDGSTALERVIESVDGVGVTVILPAGNTGADRAHTTVAVADTVSRFVVEDYTPIVGQQSFAVLSFWFPGESTISVTYAETLTVGPGQLMEFDAGEGGRLTIDNASAGIDPRNGDKNVLVWLDDGGGSSPAPGASFNLEFTSDAEGHGWQGSGNIPLRFVEGSGRNGDYTVTMPATGRGGLAVGATRNRALFSSAGGGIQIGPSAADVPTRSRVPYSSRGPTRDERRKPDLVAPGSFLVAALATNLRDAVDDFFVDPDRDYVVAEGTSQAAAVVTGIVALMLEKNPNLPSSRIRQILTETATVDEFTGPTWNTEYGAGAVDAQRALRAVLRPVAVGGDVDGDGRTTVGDVVLLARHVVDPNGVPLPTEARAAADLAPVPGGDGRLDLRDVARVLGVVLDESGVGDPVDPSLLRVTTGAARAHGSRWVVPVIWEGRGGAAFGFDLVSSTGGMADAPIRSLSGDHAVFDHGDETRRTVIAFGAAGDRGPATFLVPVTGPRAIVRVTSTRAAGLDGVERTVEEGGARSTATVLAFRGSPNPASGPVHARLVLSREADVELLVFDVRGRRIGRVYAGRLAAGAHALSWEGRDDKGRAVAPGAYFLRLDAGGEVWTRKIIVQR